MGDGMVEGNAAHGSFSLIALHDVAVQLVPVREGPGDTLRLD